MNDFWKTILGGIARAGVASAGGYAVAKGTLTADDVTQLAGTVSVLGAGIWSIVQKVRAKNQ